MRSLTFKLILTFLAVSVAGTLLAAFLIRERNERAFDRLIREQAEALVLQDLRAYYATYGSWDGVERFWRSRYVHSQPGRPPRPPAFALADARGVIIMAEGAWRLGQAVAADELQDGLPVMVAGEKVGTVFLLDQNPARDLFEERYLAGVDQALLLGALGATALAILLGAVLARALTQPIREVAAASHAVARGELGRQVPVRTQDELGDLARAFNQMSADIARATQQRQQMTADIAHDLRTPLTVLAGYLEAMEEGTLTPTNERLAIMQQEVSGLTRLVEDLRTLSLADAGELPLHLEEVDLAQLLQQVQQAYLPHAQRRGLSLEVRSHGDLPSLQVDADRLRQVLGNLVSNALRHTEAGGRILLEAEQSGPGEMLLRVRDSGSGIATADLPYIFDRFYRGDKARQETEGESGLGLAIARSLVEMHGGTISVESAPELGTTFFVRLPLSPQRDGPV